MKSIITLSLFIFGQLFIQGHTINNALRNDVIVDDEKISHFPFTEN